MLRALFEPPVTFSSYQTLSIIILARVHPLAHAVPVDCLARRLRIHAAARVQERRRRASVELLGHLHRNGRERAQRVKHGVLRNL